MVARAQERACGGRRLCGGANRSLPAQTAPSRSHGSANARAAGDNGSRDGSPGDLASSQESGTGRSHSHRACQAPVERRGQDTTPGGLGGGRAASLTATAVPGRVPLPPAPFPSRDFSKCSSGPQEPENDWPCNSRAETGSTRRAVGPEPRGLRRGQRARRVPLQGGGSRVRICALPSSPTTAVCPFHNAEQCLATATQSGPWPGLPAARAPQSAGLSSAWKSFFEWQARPLSSGDPRAPRGAQPRAAAVLALWGGAGDVPGARRIK